MSEPAEERPAWNRWELLLLALALLPPAYLLRTILRLGVDTPYMDQWETAALFANWSDGTLGFGDLWAQQNESRMVFPRLLFLGLGLATGWNVVAEMIPAFLLAAFASWAIGTLDRRVLGGPRAATLGRLAFANLLLFGPIQYENWLWGHQAVVFVPPACLLGGFLVASSRRGTGPRWIAAGALALVATFSFANGMLLWLLLPLALLSGDEPDPRARRRRAAIWTSVAVASIAIYMAGYVKPEAQPGFLETLRHPLRAAQYMAVLLGSPLAQGIGHTGIEAATAIGVAGMLLAVAVLEIGRGSGFRDPEWRARTLPWFLLFGYALGTALITTVGRSGFDVPHALSPRYATVSAIFWAALAYMGAAAAPVAVRTRALGLTGTRLAAAAAGLAAVAVFCHVLATRVAILRSENWRVRRLEARACLAFVEVAPNERFLAVNCYPDVAKLRERAAAVDRLGLLRPAIVKPDALPSILGAAPDAAFGAFNAFAPAGDAIGCRGTAVLPGRGEPPDAILVGWLDEGGARGVVAVAQSGKRRLSNREPPTADFERTTEWECRVPLASIPASVRALRAWAYDTETGRATLLPGTAAIPGR